MEPTSEVWRRWIRNLGIIALLYVVGTAIAFFWAVHQAHVHRHWEQQVEILILQFARKRPPEVPPETWAKCLQWTLMLHGEYGGLSYFPSAAREPLIHDLERHLAEPVTLQTIDAIWDDYVRHAPRANSYLRFRPTTPEMQEGYSTDETIESLLRRLEELERQQ